MHDPDEEASLEETVQAALKQIREKKYEQTLLAQGIREDGIHRYGFVLKVLLNKFLVKETSSPQYPPI